MRARGRGRAHRTRAATARRRKRKQRKRRQRPLLYQAKQERRRRRSIRRRRGLQSRPWWQRWPLEVLALEQHFPPEYQGDFLRKAVGKALVYFGEVDVPHTGQLRKVSMVFPGPPSRVRPVVMADGPRTPRHRFGSYRPEPLCLWYAGDPEAMKWTLKDGLGSLIDLTRLHLAKESWCRATGSWPGQEVHLRRELRPDAPPPSLRRRPRAAVRHRRQRCWCGNRRYANCHGRIPPEDERGTGTQMITSSA